MSPGSSSQPSSEKSAVDASDTTIKPFGAAFAGPHLPHDSERAQQGSYLTLSLEVGLPPSPSLRRSTGERAERSRDKERWYEHMAEVEGEVESIIQDLEAKVEKAEAAARDCPRLLRSMDCSRS